MERLSFDTLKKLGYEGYLLENAPEKIVQFGEGNFLRAFADNFIDLMNEKAGFNAKVVLVQPRGGHPEAADRFGEQDGLYTLILRGRENGQPVEHTRVISAASRCLDPKRDWAKLLDCARNPELRFVISNTTEAGIAFDPACKAEDTPPSAFPAKLTLFLHERWKLGLPGIIILSCELIDHNGQELHRCVQEYVKLWGLEDTFSAWLEKDNVFCSTLVDRIVTGGAKGEAPALWEKFGYEDQLIDTGEVFAASVIDRFDNPYIDHQLLDIALNSASKWNARVMPSLTEFVKRKGGLPKRLSFSLAAFIAFYHKGERGGEAYPVRDDPWALEFFAEHKDDDNAALAKAVVNDERLWDGQLAKIEGLEERVAACLDRIDEIGMYDAMKECAE